VKKLLK